MEEVKQILQELREIRKLLELIKINTYLLERVNQTYEKVIRLTEEIRNREFTRGK